ncbi:M14 family metallocarboxypeptidase [Chromatiaceae bacterium AAb-1]|nr:M14 family metallocarboxypeptidase [Chromatiaceae bacterium AAb-1]
MTDSLYHIGVPGQPWGPAEKTLWLSEQKIRRSYHEIVLSRLEAIKTLADVEQYGELDYQSIGASRYPLYLVKSRNWQAGRPTVLVTGGVHGYETSGVLGALAFIEQHIEKYSQQLNVVVAPCISPWGFETINRWNPLAVDPNRSFVENSPAPEAAALLNALSALLPEIKLHIDLHETTDSDNSEFRPAKAARDGLVNTNWNIPDGFYLVGDTEKPAAAFQQAVIEAVSQVTHIAEADDDGRMIGEPLLQHGVILYAKKQLGLCGGITDAPLVTTTEVYPDSPVTTPEECTAAQVTAICAALDYLLA